MGIGGFDNLIEQGAAIFGLGGTFPLFGGGTGLLIEEKEGDQPRTIMLKGRAMPYRGVEWPVEMRQKTTWYPGSPVATQQVLGPQEMSTEMTGMWKDRFIGGEIEINGNPAEIDTAEKAVKLFENLVRAGKQLRVQWLSTVRTGLLIRFTPRWDRAQDLEWDMEWEWNSRNDEEAARAAVVAPPTSDLFNIFNLIEDILSTLSDVLDFTQAFTATLVTLVNDIRDIVSGLFDSLRIVDTLVSVPGQLLGSINAAAASLVRELTELIRSITGQRTSATPAAAPVLGSTSSPLTQRKGAAPASSSVTQQAKFNAILRSMALAAVRLRFTTQQIVASVNARVQPATQRVIEVPEGGSLYSVSLAIYGTPDFAGFIAQVNRKSSALVPPGTKLRIPPRPFGAAARVELSGAPLQAC